MSDNDAPPVRCTERMGETEAAHEPGVEREVGAEQCCHGLSGRLRPRCTNRSAWISTFHGKDCRGAQGGLGWCAEHKPHMTTAPHGLRRLGQGEQRRDSDPRLSPIDPKLSDCGGRRSPCAGEGGWGAKVVGSMGCDARSSSLQRMVRRFRSIRREAPAKGVLGLYLAWCVAAGESSPRQSCCRSCRGTSSDWGRCR